jgi:hypothetical protein
MSVSGRYKHQSDPYHTQIREVLKTVNFCRGKGLLWRVIFRCYWLQSISKICWHNEISISPFLSPVGSDLTRWDLAGFLDGAVCSIGWRRDWLNFVMSFSLALLCLQGHQFVEIQGGRYGAELRELVVVFMLSRLSTLMRSPRTRSTMSRPGVEFFCMDGVRWPHSPWVICSFARAPQVRVAKRI